MASTDTEMGPHSSARAEAKLAQTSLAFSSLGHFFAHFFPLLYATVVLVLVEQFAGSYGQLITLATAGLVLYGVAAPVAGWLGDRWSAVGMMVVFFVGTGLSSIAVGLSGSTTAIMVGLASLGLFGAIYHPVGIAWLFANARKKGRAFGINGVFGSVGMAAAPVFAGALIQWWTWQAVFILPGIVAILCGLALLAMWRMGMVRDASKDVRPEAPASFVEARQVFIVLSLTMLVTGFIYQALSMNMPKLFEERLGSITGSGEDAAAVIGAFVSAVFVFTAAANLLGGWLADKLSAKTAYISMWLLQMPVLLLAVNMFGVPLFALVVVAMVLNVAILPTENMLIAKYTPQKWRATAYGLKFILAFGMSAAAIPIAGYAYDETGGFGMVFWIMAAGAVFAIVAALFLPSARRDDMAIASQAGVAD